MSLKLSTIFIISLLSLLVSNNAFGYTDSELSQMYKGDGETSTLAKIQNAINDKTLKCSDLPVDIIAFNCPDTQAKLDAMKGKSPTNPLSDNGSYYAGTHIIDENSPTYKAELAKSRHSEWIGVLIGGILDALFILQFLRKLNKSNLTRFGYMFFIGGFTAITLILASSMDENGKVGACVIAGGITFGIGIAFLVRGNQEDKSRPRTHNKTIKESRGTMPKGFGTDELATHECLADGCTNKPIIKIKAVDGDDYYCDKHYQFMVKEGAIIPQKTEPVIIDHSLFHQVLLSLGIIKVKKQ